MLLQRHQYSVVQTVRMNGSLIGYQVEGVSGEEFFLDDQARFPGSFLIRIGGGLFVGGKGGGGKLVKIMTFDDSGERFDKLDR